MWEPILEDILKRIQKHCNLHTDAEVADRLNMSKQELYGFKKRNKVPYRHIMHLCHEETMSTDYLLWGKGEKLASNEESQKGMDAKYKEITRLKKENDRLWKLVEGFQSGKIQATDGQEETEILGRS